MVERVRALGPVDVALDTVGGALPDLIKADNLMMRKDGTLVFSDPVFME